MEPKMPMAEKIKKRQNNKEDMKNKSIASEGESRFQHEKKTESSEIWKGYAKKESINMENGTTVEFLKVRHSKETLEQFLPEIKKYIQNADVVLSELAVFEDDDSESNMKVFYKKITQIAKENNKKMVVADPEKEYSDAFINRAIDIAPMLASVGSGIYVAKKLSELSGKLSLRRSYKKNNIETRKEAIISRRDFLKSISAAGIMMTGGLSGIAGALDEMGVGKEKGELLETFLLSSLDYRNALVTKEIISLSREYEKISVIYGCGHYEGIKKFLTNSKLLDKKIKAYEKTYNLVNNDVVDTYNFNKPNDISEIEKDFL